MNPPFFVPIVEGHGEIEALPRLIRRVFETYQGDVVPAINPPSRIKAGSFLNDEAYFNKYVAQAAAKAAQGNGIVLIVLDCEDDCPATLGPSILAKARAVRANIQYEVVLAHREYETWFLAAADSLKGYAGLPSDLVPPADPESIRGAKEWLSNKMSVSYDPIIHQVKFTSRFDIDKARTISSFDRFVKKLLSCSAS